MASGTSGDAPDGASSRTLWRWLPLALALAAFGLVLSAYVADAQLAVGRVELVMHPEDRASQEATIGVRNEGDQVVQAIIRLEDWNRAGDGTNRWFPYGTHAGNGSCAPALSIFPQAIRLEPGAHQSIRVTLDSTKVPRTECWSAAVFETVQHGERGGQAVSYVLRTAVKIYVQPAGLGAEGEIESFKVVSDSSAPNDTVLEVRFANTGERHVVAHGVLEVRAPDNTLVRRLEMPAIYALPGARQTVRMPMPALQRGDYVLLATVDYGGTDIVAALLEHRRP